jgi:hypothetical protein
VSEFLFFHFAAVFTPEIIISAGQSIIANYLLISLTNCAIVIDGAVEAKGPGKNGSPTYNPRFFLCCHFTKHRKRTQKRKNNESKQVCLAESSHLDVKSDATTKLVCVFVFVPDQERACVCNINIQRRGKLHVGRRHCQRAAPRSPCSR